MRTIEWTTQFKRDYKREAKGLYRSTLTKDLDYIVTTLANDEPLADKHHDHALSGEWKDHRDCHVKPDLILIYRKSIFVEESILIETLVSFFVPSLESRNLENSDLRQ